MARLRLAGIFGRRAHKPAPPRARLSVDCGGGAIYAVGDIHGCFDELMRLEEAIVRDASALPGRKLMVMLGDYVDRGPRSARVLDHLLAPPPRDFDRICLAGNHEEIMLDYLEGRAPLARWMRLGAGSTLMSYGIDPERLKEIYGTDRAVDDAIRSTIPDRHRVFLRDLPVALDTGRHLFVHAGVRGGISLADHTDAQLVSLRMTPGDPPSSPTHYVVHGHTPVETVEMRNRRVNVDTGAYATGRLSALRIWQNQGYVLST